MLRGWLHGKKGQNASTQSLDALAEAQNREWRALLGRF